MCHYLFLVAELFTVVKRRNEHKMQYKKAVKDKKKGNTPLNELKPNEYNKMCKDVCNSIKRK